MDSTFDSDPLQQRQDRLLGALERLVELPATDVAATLNQTAQLIADIFESEKGDIFLYDPDSETLVALGTSDTPMGRRQRAIGLDRLPLANGGRSVETFLTGKPFLTGRADQDPDELPGLKGALGVVSEMAVVFEIQQQHRGVLAVNSTSPEAFSAQDLRFLEAIGRWIGIVIDRAELVQRIQQESVDWGRRLAAEELLTIMAHDLHNYLTPLSGRLELLERRAQREERAQDSRDVQAMKHTLGLLDRVITDLLDVARLNQGIFMITPQPMNLIDLIQLVMQAFQSTQTPIELHAPKELILSADPNRLRQVLENLLANAIKYAPRQTPISIQAQVERQAEDGPRIVLTVSNQGRGIPASQLDYLFNPFVAGEQSHGLGLGLYLARRIAQAHHGNLTAASAMGQGVTMTLTLPIEDDEIG